MVCDDVYVITSPCLWDSPIHPCGLPRLVDERPTGVYYWCTIYSDTSVFRGPVVNPQVSQP